MDYKFKYEIPEERQEIIDAHQSLRIIEEQNIIDGRFIIFTDEKPTQ